METKKVTITIPKNLYDKSMNMVKRGLFSNFSDLVRSGIREEFKELHSVSEEFDEKYIKSNEKSSS